MIDFKEKGGGELTTKLFLENTAKKKKTKQKWGNP